MEIEEDLHAQLAVNKQLLDEARAERCELATRLSIADAHIGRLMKERDQWRDEVASAQFVLGVGYPIWVDGRRTNLSDQIRAFIAGNAKS